MPEYTRKFVRDVVKPGKQGLLSTPEGKGRGFLNASRRIALHGEFI